MFYLEFLSTDFTRDVAEGHVADLSAHLQRLVQMFNHGVQAVGNQSDLLVEIGVRVQIAQRNVSESRKLGVELRILGEQTENCAIIYKPEWNFK